MTRSLAFRDSLGVTHRVRFSTGGISIPPRLCHLTPQIDAVLDLDAIKTQIVNYNRKYCQNRALGYAPESGWCSDCQTYLEAGQHCGCRA